MKYDNEMWDRKTRNTEDPVFISGDLSSLKTLKTHNAFSLRFDHVKLNRNVVKNLVEGNIEEAFGDIGLEMPTNIFFDQVDLSSFLLSPDAVLEFDKFGISFGGDVKFKWPGGQVETTSQRAKRSIKLYDQIDDELELLATQAKHKTLPKSQLATDLKRLVETHPYFVQNMDITYKKEDDALIDYRDDSKEVLRLLLKELKR